MPVLNHAHKNPYSQTLYLPVMKRYTCCIFALAFAFAACKKLAALSPITITDTAKTTIVGPWTWSAQYGMGQNPTIQDPANTGINETLQMNADSTWTQTKNGAVVNTGTYLFSPFPEPAGPPATFIYFTNSKYPGEATFDNFDFNYGFMNSFTLTKDTLVFIGESQIDTGVYAAHRVYVR